MGIYAAIMRLDSETLQDLHTGRKSFMYVGPDEAAKGRPVSFEDEVAQLPQASAQVFAYPDQLDFSRLRHLDLHTQFSMILYQLSETFRREGGNVFRVGVDDPIAGVVTGTFILDADAEADLPLRGAWPKEVADLSRRLDTVSEADFLTVHRTEPPAHGKPGGYPYRFRDLSDPKNRALYRNALHNLKAFYRTAADAGEAMLYSAS